MDNIQTITLDICDISTFEYLYVKQYDVGRTFLFNITENGQEYDLTDVTARIGIEKPDKTVIFADCEIENNRVKYITNGNLSVESGIGLVEIILTTPDKLYNTVYAKIKIGEAVVKHDSIVSTDEFSALTAALLRLKKIEEDEKIRIVNEDERKENESNRIVSETSRIESELIRESNEAIRTENENNRESIFNDSMETLEEEISKAENVNVELIESDENYKVHVVDRNGTEKESPNLLNKISIGEVETGEYDEDVSVSITGEFGNQKLNLRLPMGKPFKIKRSYSSVSELESNIATDLELYDFAMVNTGSVEDEDTGKLYMNDVDGALYLCDLSGVQGIQGVKGEKGDAGNKIIYVGEEEWDEDKINRYKVGKAISYTESTFDDIKSGDICVLYVKRISNDLHYTYFIKAKNNSGDGEELYGTIISIVKDARGGNKLITLLNDEWTQSEIDYIIGKFAVAENNEAYTNMDILKGDIFLKNIHNVDNNLNYLFIFKSLEDSPIGSNNIIYTIYSIIKDGEKGDSGSEESISIENGEITNNGYDGISDPNICFDIVGSNFTYWDGYEHEVVEQKKDGLFFAGGTNENRYAKIFYGDCSLSNPARYDFMNDDMADDSTNLVLKSPSHLSVFGSRYSRIETLQANEIISNEYTLYGGNFTFYNMDIESGHRNECTTLSVNKNAVTIEVTLPERSGILALDDVATVDSNGLMSANIVKELMDCRVGFDGTVYNNIGDAIRGQSNILSDIPIGTILNTLNNQGNKFTYKNFVPMDGRLIKVGVYPDFEKYLMEQFGVLNYYGGDGIYNYAMPDCQVVYHDMSKVTASSNSEYSNQWSAKCAIDGKFGNNAWLSEPSSYPRYDIYLELDYGIKTCLDFIELYPREEPTTIALNITDFILKGSNDCESWTEISTYHGLTYDLTYNKVSVNVNSTENYRYYRLYNLGDNSYSDGVYNIQIGEIKTGHKIRNEIIKVK